MQQQNNDNQDQLNAQFEQANSLLQLNQWKEALLLFLELDKKGLINNQLFLIIAKLYIQQDKYCCADWYINKIKTIHEEVYEYKEIIQKNLYKIFATRDGQFLGNMLQFRLKKMAILSSSIGQPKEALIAIQEKRQTSVEPHIIVQIYLQLHLYEETIQYIKENKGLLRNTDYFIGFCQFYLKNYKQSLLYFQKIEEKTEQVYYFIRLLKKYLNLEIDKIYPSDNYNYDAISYGYVYQIYNRLNLDEINEMCDKLITIILSKSQLHILVYVYHEIFQMKFYQSYYENKEFLWKVVEYMIINGSKYAEGYADKYLLLMKEENYQDIYNLIQSLTECEDSSTKFKCLAQIYSVIGEDNNSISYLNQALQINKYDSETFELIIKISCKNNNFQIAQNTLEQYIQLEKENMFLITNYFYSFIQKYQYHKAYQLLLNVDQTQHIDYLKLILKLLIYPSQTTTPSVQELINLLPRNNPDQSALKLLLQGHLMFKQQNLTGAMAQYYFSSTPLKNSNQQIKLSQVQDLLSKLKQQQQFGYSVIHDEICQLILENYQIEPINLIDRFLNCFWYILSSFIFDSQYNQLIEWFNNQTDCLIEVFGMPVIPQVEEINQNIKNTIQQFYHISKFSSEQYFIYLNKTQEQLQKLFKSFINLYDELTKFSQINQNQLLLQLQKLKFNQQICIYPVSQLFNYPLFYDPISKLALLQFIKFIGYYNEYCLSEEFQNVQALLQFIFFTENIEAYFNSLPKQIQQYQ